ncbi:DUF6519 domain-containing protein [Sulfurirhabdus autotrophica]|uniref:Uncharacterized protein n=2 Tax=Sulfurirhabdus autotrophica TaxID=1706046 RepID=A0A4R3Y4R1_9PROT|nr:DUF6519 domain-containing protein [Sulfurirhabdus autotrophica]TCV86740.1 hypothetical protein EDC63_106101 [Sulfurirhabdus autotrophica]
MKGDFTRDTFDAAKHFSRVLMQQGRVQVDADWNEQTSILLHYLHTLAKDILGPYAGPANAMGFDLITKDNIAKIDAMEPDPVRREALRKKVEEGDAAIGTGRYYVQGVLVENLQAILYTEQTGYLYFPEEIKLENLKNKALLAYLDVWERHITYVEDDHIREVALGGPDTCTRAQVVWQVKALLRPENFDQAFDCQSLDTLLSRQLPKLRARALQEKPVTDLCVISPESRYRGAENQLYRVEVHRGGFATDNPATSATFKWSRENGSVTFPILTLSDTTATLENLGRDNCLGLKQGDWVEAIDDNVVMGGQSGPLAQVESVDRDTLTVTLKWAVSHGPTYVETDSLTSHPLLRRWDHQGDPDLGGALEINDQDNSNAGLGIGWINLEDGVQIWFSKEGGEYRTGDYWLIPARVATGDVEWPKEPGANSLPVAIEPHGPRHYYAPLFLELGEGQPGRDCRCEINSLQCIPSS